MVHAVALQHVVVHILVLKSQLHAEVHLKAALALAYQAQVAVVDEDVHIGQAKLGAHGQLFHHELEVVVT